MFGRRWGRLCVLSLIYILWSNSKKAANLAKHAAQKFPQKITGKLTIHIFFTKFANTVSSFYFKEKQPKRKFEIIFLQFLGGPLNWQIVFFLTSSSLLASSKPKEDISPGAGFKTV